MFTVERDAHRGQVAAVVAEEKDDRALQHGLALEYHVWVGHQQAARLEKADRVGPRATISIRGAARVSGVGSVRRSGVVAGTHSIFALAVAGGIQLEPSAFRAESVVHVV